MLFNAVQLLLGINSFLEHPLGIYLAGIGVLFNHLIQYRLGKARFIAFVVAVSAVAKQVNINIFMEFFTKLEGSLHGIYHCFGVVAIHMKHGRLGNFCNIGAIHAGTRIEVVGSEPNLVVNDKMYCAAGFVAFQLRHLGNFVNDSLSGNASIAMNQNGGHLAVITFIYKIHFCSCDALHHRINGFKV